MTKENEIGGGQDAVPIRQVCVGVTGTNEIYTIDLLEAMPDAPVFGDRHLLTVSHTPPQGMFRKRGIRSSEYTLVKSYRYTSIRCSPPPNLLPHPPPTDVPSPPNPPYGLHP